jgi:hypothetical protein
MLKYLKMTPPDFVFAADAHGLIQRVVQWS